jgi:hypothetical protein
MNNPTLDRRFDYALFMYIFFIPFSVSEDFRALTGPIPASVLLTLLISIMVFWMHKQYAGKWPLIYNQKMNLPFKMVLICFFLPVLLSSISALTNEWMINAAPYHAYFEKDLLNRLINLGLFFILFISLVPMIDHLSEKRLHTYIRAYWIAVSVLLFVGFWQFLHLAFGVPMFQLDTRSYVHSVGEGATLFFDFRLTSFASEPSYMVPFVIDGFLVGALVFKDLKKYLIWSFLPASFILLFSFSLGGYLNFALVFAGFLFLIFTTDNPYKLKIIKGLAVLIGLFTVIALIKMSLILEFVGPVLGRLDTVFDMQEHERLFLIIMPFIWIFQHSQTFLQILFGMGPGSFKYLNITQFFPDDLHKVYVTSNNFYIDVLYEHGWFGFLLSFVLMGYFLYYFFKRRHKGRYAVTGFLITLHLSITSLYRADFTSPRFWMLFILLFILIRFLYSQHEKRSEA